MNMHEFGKENKKILLLIHPSVVKWDYFEYVIPLLQEKYHLLIPALPGYDFENDSDFTNVEQIASELNDWLWENGYWEIYAVYGCLFMTCEFLQRGIRHTAVPNQACSPMTSRIPFTPTRWQSAAMRSVSWPSR